MSLRKKLAILIAAEVFYFILTRLLVIYWPNWTWEIECVRSVLRSAAAFIFWYLFRDIIIRADVQLKKALHPLSIISISLLFAVPLLVGDWSFMDELTRWVFAVTSIFVALHEEFLFRGVVQNLLERRWGIYPAILISSAIMTVWHFGMVPFIAFNFVQVFMVSCLLGLMYWQTRSIFLVVMLHMIYDALYSLTPFMEEQASLIFGLCVLLSALLSAWLWAFYGRVGQRS